jgi:hypothetical protein
MTAASYVLAARFFIWIRFLVRLIRLRIVFSNGFSSLGHEATTGSHVLPATSILIWSALII